MTEDTKPASNLDQLCINTIRTLAMDAVEKANSGHPGAPMGMAPMAYVLWTKFLKHNPKDPNWFDRDRFLLSAGHASMLLYSLLHLTGYDLALEDLKQFRQWESRTPGHPEYRHTPGVETTTGPLGQGFANGVGMAIAERVMSDKFNRPGLSLVDHYTYSICSDGDLMEGVSSEAASLAGHLQLGKLVYLYDANRITIDGSTDLSFSENVSQRFEAYGWHVQEVSDGNDVDGLTRAISAAKGDPRPSLIAVSTHIGYGAPTKQDTSKAHGAPLGPDEVRAAKEFFGWDPDKTFFVPTEALDEWRKAVPTGKSAQDEWQELFGKYQGAHPADAREFTRVVERKLPKAWDADLPDFKPEDGPMATRKASGKTINALASRIPELIGGSADLAESNLTDIEGGGNLSAKEVGRNIRFGIREHAMGSAMNGMAVHGGLRPFGGTFLIFSDYMRPTIRLAGLMKAPVIYVFTHDSVGLGEDGPTHEPIEHLASLRAIPNVILIRPADAAETAEAWRTALSLTEGRPIGDAVEGHVDQIADGPVALALTRQNLPIFDRAKYGPVSGVAKGAYVLSDSGTSGLPELIFIATGSEVFLAVEAAEELSGDGIAVRVVSMPSWELFERQPQTYKDEVLPPNVTKRISVEAATTFGWDRWIGLSGKAIGIDRFGASAPGEIILKELGFNKANLVKHARDLLKTAR